MDMVADNNELYEYIQTREQLNILRNLILKDYRKGKRGRPYQPIKHYTREQLNEMRNNKLNEINDTLEIHV